ncbi:MAG: hypothetical protein C4526_09590 [Nitrospiraceae bacterium]|nr:MAG: hypothetical protein C4526_09590 [Nitrospiraceae bacterium]
MNAENVNSLANWVLIISLAVGVVATYFIVVSGNEKERKLKLELSKANADAEKAKSTAAEANTKTAELNFKVEQEARKRAEAELALETLRGKLRGRSLSQKQRDILLLSLRQFSGATISVTSLGDKESATFADQIISVIQEAGIVVVRNFVGTLSPPQYGIIISPDLKPAFHDAFKKAQIDIKIGRATDSNIFIGLKPPIDT